MSDFRPYPKEQQLKHERKPYWRKVAGPKRWAAIRDEKCRKCRVCGARSYYSIIDAHHLVPRDRAGGDTMDNIIGLCRKCHGGVENRNRAHVRTLLSRLTDAEYAYAISQCGEQFAEHVYGLEYLR